MKIRYARTSELELLQAIEVASGEPFRDFGMPEIADDDPLPLDNLEHAQASGHVWVAADPGPVAWIAVEIIDGYAHIRQVSVHPSHARQGIGARLIDHVETWAVADGLAGLTLTTFRDIPWNAPYYQRLGFQVVTELTPGLADIVATEAEHGLDPATRVCMRRTRPARADDFS